MHYLKFSITNYPEECNHNAIYDWIVVTQAQYNLLASYDDAIVFTNEDGTFVLFNTSNLNLIKEL